MKSWSTLEPRLVACKSELVILFCQKLTTLVDTSTSIGEFQYWVLRPDLFARCSRNND